MLDEIIPAGAPRSGIVRRGQLLRITDLHGRQAVDSSATMPPNQRSATTRPTP
jgi:uncharacterized protein YcgI (DUF1989 family)